MALLPGCKERVKSPAAPENASLHAQVTSGEYQEEFLTYAINNLNHIEEFSTADAIGQAYERLRAQTTSPSDASADTLLACWPEPEILRLSIQRLNQWIRAQRPPEDWQIDPMMTHLPARWAALPLVKDLDKMEFCRFDGYALQEAVWLRDISTWARGETLDDLDRAKALFDWTVRNIQFGPPTPNRIPQFPWETLLFGRGSASDRAWVFILLARQQGIDAAMLAFSPAAAADGPIREAETENLTGDDVNGGAAGSNEKTDAGAPPEPWCVGVLANGQVYLFDPALGLPIPGPKGVSCNAAGQLSFQPATFAQVKADEGLLRRLDADETHAYGVKSSDLDRVCVLLEASPTYVSKRMQIVESHLAGGNKVVLTTSPTAQAEHWKTAGLSNAQVWRQPLDTIDARSHLDSKAVQIQLAAMLPFYGNRDVPLLKGRILQLKGKLTGDEGASYCYQKARPSTQNLISSQGHPIEKQVQVLAKQSASYWLGLIQFERANYSAAIDFFRKFTLEATPNGPWTIGAQYNLARTCEASGETPRAILQYRSNANSPGYHGDLLRAKWLEELANANPQSAP